MPKAKEPKAPCANPSNQDMITNTMEPRLLDVWESPQTQVIPGRVNPCSGPMIWTMPVEGVNSNLHNGRVLFAPTLSPIGQAEVRQSKFFDIFFQRQTLGARIGLGNKRRDGGEVFARVCPRCHSEST
jgi:hypothetical protein